jgi:hypothetical protein
MTDDGHKKGRFTLYQGSGQKPTDAKPAELKAVAASERERAENERIAFLRYEGDSDDPPLTFKEEGSLNYIKVEKGQKAIWRQGFLLTLRTKQPPEMLLAGIRKMLHSLGIDSLDGNFSLDQGVWLSREAIDGILMQYRAREGGANRSAQSIGAEFFAEVKRCVDADFDARRFINATRNAVSTMQPTMDILFDPIDDGYCVQVYHDQHNIPATALILQAVALAIDCPERDLTLNGKVANDQVYVTHEQLAKAIAKRDPEQAAEAFVGDVIRTMVPNWKPDKETNVHRMQPATTVLRVVKEPPTPRSDPSRRR